MNTYHKVNTTLPGEVITSGYAHTRVYGNVDDFIRNIIFNAYRKRVCDYGKTQDKEMAI